MKIKEFFMPEQHSMKQTYVWTAVGGAVYAGSSFLMSMITSNYLGTSAAGILALALTVGSQLVTIGYFNIRAFQVSDVLEKYSFGDYCVFRILTVTAMLIAGIVWIVRDSYTGVKLAAVAMAILFRIEEAVSDLLEGRYQQKSRYDVSCRGMFIKTLLYLSAFIVVLFLTKNLLWAMLAMDLTYIVSIIVIDSQLIGSFGGVSFQSSFRRQRNLFIEGLPLFVNAFLNAYIINASKYAVDRYFNSSMLGIYNALYMMAFVVNMFSSFVLKPIVSVLAERYASGDVKGFLNLIGRQIMIILGLTAICIAGAYIAGIPVMSILFGVDLSGYKGALCLVLVSGGFTALYQLFQYGIIIMRHQYSSFVCCGVTAVLTYITTPILTKRYAIMGAAASYVLSIGMMSLLFVGFFIFHLIKDKNRGEII